MNSTGTLYGVSYKAGTAITMCTQSGIALYLLSAAWWRCLVSGDGWYCCNKRLLNAPQSAKTKKKTLQPADKSNPPYFHHSAVNEARLARIRISLTEAMFVDDEVHLLEQGVERLIVVCVRCHFLIRNQ